MRNSIFNTKLKFIGYRQCLVIKACRDDDFIDLYNVLNKILINSKITLFCNEKTNVSTRDKKVYYNGNISIASIYELNDKVDKYDAIFCLTRESGHIKNINLFWFIRKFVVDGVAKHDTCFVIDVDTSIISDYMSNWGVVYNGELYRIGEQFINAPFIEKADLIENSQLRNKHYGTRCFIIGNGPSVATQNIIPLKDELTITMNSFYFHKNAAEVNPKYYLFGHMSLYKEEAHVEIMRLQQEVLKNSIFLFSHGKYGLFNSKELIDKNGLFKGSLIYYLRYAGMYSTNMELEIDLTKSMPIVSNTAVACLAAALYMGFKEIYLLGSENDMIHHFPKDYNHFYKCNDYSQYCKYEKGEYYTYSEIVEFTNYNWVSFWALKKYAENRGQKIYNATPNSKLDMFEQVVYEDVIGR